MFDGNDSPLNPTEFRYGEAKAKADYETYSLNINSSGGVFKGAGDFNGYGFDDVPIADIADVNTTVSIPYAPFTYTYSGTKLNNINVHHVRFGNFFIKN